LLTDHWLHLHFFTVILYATFRTSAQQFIANSSGTQQPSGTSSAKLNSLASIPTAVIRKMKVDEKLSKDG
jgi:hypothetical protein